MFIVLLHQGALARTKFDGNARAQELEAWIDAADARLSPLRTFIVPGGGYAGTSSKTRDALLWPSDFMRMQRPRRCMLQDQFAGERNVTLWH